MTKYAIIYTKAYKKAIKRYDTRTIEEISSVLERLANDEMLEPKYRDHKLQGNLKDFRECHIRPDLCLIYQKQEDMMILSAINVGSHSELF